MTAECVTVITGEYAAPILRALFDEHGFDDVEVKAVKNRYFGGNIKVAGLLTGQDLQRGPRRGRSDDASVSCPTSASPRAASSTDSTLEDLPRPVTSVADDGPRTCVDALESRARAEPEPRVRRPQVVIVGRPNVGKSSLVNRLAGRRIAVVEEQPRGDPRPQGRRGRVAGRGL